MSPVCGIFVTLFNESAPRLINSIRSDVFLSVKITAKYRIQYFTILNKLKVVVFSVNISYFVQPVLSFTGT